VGDFEAGFGAAQPGSEIAPISLASARWIPFRFHWLCINAFNLSITIPQDLCFRLLTRYDIAFDEEMAKPALKRAIKGFLDIHGSVAPLFADQTSWAYLPYEMILRNISTGGCFISFNDRHHLTPLNK